MAGPVRVAVDALGSDHGPDAIVAGAVEARSGAIEPVLVGPPGLDTQDLELIEATQEIAMHEKPADAVRGKADSSLVVACRAVHEGRADAVVSAGNTGAMLAACLVYVRRLPGVLRPAIAVMVPTPKGPSVLVDAGANADCRAEHLFQFAVMGSIFAEEIFETRNPTVALLSIGEEPEKGNQLTLEAHELLQASGLNFQGNVESRWLLGHAADVVVTDGFTGNVALKLLEGTIRTTLDWLRTEITATPTGRLGGALIRPDARRLRAHLDPDTYGGAYLLGLRGLAVIAHGNSSPAAIASAVRLAARGVEHGVVPKLGERLARETGEQRVSIRALSESNPQER